MGFGDAFKWMGRNASWLLPTAIGGYDAIQRGREGARARDLEDEGLALSREQWAERAPFRQYALSGLQALGTPQQTQVLFQDLGNPYSATFAEMHGRDLGAELMPQAPSAAPPPSTVTPIGAAGDGRPMTDAERQMLAERQRNMNPGSPLRAPGVPWQSSGGRR